MPRSIILFLISLFSSFLSNSQKIGKYYVSIPSDSALDCRLRFLSDSTVELSSVQRHQSARFFVILNYKKSDATINVTDVQPPLTRFGIKANIRLTQIESGFVDFENGLIYVRQKKQRGSYVFFYIINGKTYAQKMAEPDGYGLIKKIPKTNRRLEKKLSEVRPNLDNCTLEFLKGFKAYQKLGPQYVGGVVIITQKGK